MSTRCFVQAVLEAVFGLGIGVAAIGAQGVPALHHPPNGTRVSQPLVPGGDVTDHEISADGSQVVYRADAEENERFELYGVSLRGAALVKLNAPLVAGGDVSPFAHGQGLSRDGRRVVYHADQDADERFELYSVPIEGGTPTPLCGPMVVGGDVPNYGDFAITADSARVIFRADRDVDQVYELYSTSITGGPVVRLNPPLVGGDVVVGFDPEGLSPDASRVVFRVGLDQLWSAPAVGGTPILLNSTIGNNVHSFRVTPDGTQVVFLLSQAPVFGQGGLFVVPIAGGPVLGLHDSPTAAAPFSIAPDSSQVLYLDSSQHLHRVPITGGPSEVLSDFSVHSLLTSKDSQWCAFESTANFTTRVFAASLSGGAAVELFEDFSFSVGAKLFSPDSSSLVIQSGSELFRVAPGGGEPLSLNPAQSDLGQPYLGFQIPRRRGVVYSASVGGQEVLYHVPLAGGSPMRLSPPMPGNQEVTRVELRGDQVVYLADQAANDVVELFRAHLAVRE